MKKLQSFSIIGLIGFFLIHCSNEKPVVYEDFIQGPEKPEIYMSGEIDMLFNSNNIAILGFKSADNVERSGELLDSKIFALFKEATLLDRSEVEKLDFVIKGEGISHPENSGYHSTTEEVYSSFPANSNMSMGFASQMDTVIRGNMDGGNDRWNENFAGFSIEIIDVKKRSPILNIDCEYVNPANETPEGIIDICVDLLIKEAKNRRKVNSKNSIE